MKYPKNLEYVKAIQDAGANLNKLAHLSPVMDDHGGPYHMSGDSSVVFKMQDKSTGKYYALKCFTIDPKELSDIHLQNAGEQNMDESSNSSSVKYLEKELLVYSRKKEKKYPVILMEWVDEEAMGAFLAADEELSTVATDEELNEAITDEFGVKYRKDGRKLLKAPQELDRTYSIRKGTKIVCDEAFGGCRSLNSLVISDGVTSIGDNAFSYCESLKSLLIPASVTSIGGGAFCGCRSLSSLVIPDSVTSIGDSAFSYCESLRSLVIPNSVGNIIGNPFSGWNGELKCLSPYFIYDNKVLFDKDKNAIISFRDKDTTSYIIPDDVTSIGDSAFEDCSSLNDIIIPDSVTSIGDSAFENCSSLSSIVLPDSVTSIGDRAFNECSSLRSVGIPDGVTSIGDNAFQFCSSLNDIIIPDSVTSIGNYAFGECSSLSSLVIPDSVTSIGDWAFYYCSALRSAVLPDGVTSIGIGAFIGCKSLKSLEIPDSVTSIGFGAFSYCYFPYKLKQKLSSRFGEKIFG